MSESLNVGIIGLGTVGRGVARILLENATNIERRSQRRIVLHKAATRTPSKVSGLNLPEGVLCATAEEVVSDPDVHVLVESIGGIDPALDYIRRALRAGKHVVTPNKEVIAKHGSELLELARQNRVNLYYEASVCGGIPILQGLKNSLAANNIEKVFGIMNGTTNFILSKMTDEGADFGEVLAEAQALGYAEADPTADVDGFDAAYKLIILAGIAFNTSFRYEDIHFEGIRNINACDISFARRLGYVIKLVGMGIDRGEQGVELRLHPVMIEADHPLANVNGSFNAVFVKGNYVGDTMFYGPGAGMFPTASAVVGDIMDIAMSLPLADSHPSMTTSFGERKCLPMDEAISEYYLRLRVKDQPGVLARIATVCGAHNVSLKTVEQPEAEEGEADLILITHSVKEGSMQAAVREISNLDVVPGVAGLIRVGLA